MNHIKKLVSGLMAGIFIGIGSLIYISAVHVNNILASFLFSIGLLLVLFTKTDLYTGKTGCLLERHNKAYLLELLESFAGNIVGAMGLGFLLKATRLNDTLNVQRINALMTRQTDSLISVFILACFCGLFVYAAVWCYKKESLHPVLRIIGVIFCVGAFVSCSFEHIVADLFFFAFSIEESTFKSVLVLISIFLGNTVGSLIIPSFMKLRDYKPKAQVTADASEIATKEIEDKHEEK